MAGETALQGLRGLSALHLLLYHSLSRTNWPQDWLVDLQVASENFFFDGSKNTLGAENHLFIPPFSFPGRDFNAPLLPYIRLLFGSLLWAAHVYS